MVKVESNLLTLGCFTLFVLAGCSRPVERFVDVDAGGHRLHLLIIGETGPTVVLESGLPGGLGWQQVRGPVGRFARAVTYDRAGIDKSEAGPLPRNAEQIAIELHTALGNAGLPPPYVLVGQSMGGPYIRVFAAKYPQDVSGMVFVDPALPERCEPLEDVKTWFAAHCPDDWERVEAACNKAPEGSDFMIASGIKSVEEYLVGLPEPRRQTMGREWWALFDSVSTERLSPKLSAGARDEFRAAADTFRQAKAAQPLPEVPIILLLAGQFDEFSGVTASLSPNTRELLEELTRRKVERYQRWIDTVPGAKLIVAKRSGHNIQSEDPRLVIDAIREVVEQAAQKKKQLGRRSPNSLDNASGDMLNVPVSGLPVSGRTIQLTCRGRCKDFTPREKGMRPRSS